MRWYACVVVGVLTARGGEESDPTGPTTGTLEIRTTTSGSAASVAYNYRVDGEPAQTIGNNAVVSPGGSGGIPRRAAHRTRGRLLGNQRPLLEVWGRSATDLYAVGVGTILHYDGQRWSEVQSGAERLAGIWTTPESEAFAVGSRGTVLRGRAGTAVAQP